MLVTENEFNCADTAKRIILIKDEFSIYAPTAFTLMVMELTIALEFVEMV